MELPYSHMLSHLGRHPPVRDLISLPLVLSCVSNTEGNSNCPVVASLRSECNVCTGKSFIEDIAICVEVV